MTEAIPGPASRPERRAEMKSARMSWALAACALVALLAAQPAAASGPAVWLNIEVIEKMADSPKVRINVPLSMMEVMVDSLDAAGMFSDLHSDHGVNMAELWRNLRDADTDEFVRIDSEEAQVQVFKEMDLLRVVVKERGFDEPNIQLSLPFAVMDYLVEGAEMGEFRLSEMVERLRGHLPLVVVDAFKDGESVRIWLEER